MYRPEPNPERGVLIALVVMALFGLCVAIIVVGTLWPRIVAFFQ